MTIRCSVFVSVAILAATAALSAATQTPADADKYWAQWRGPYATGVSKSATPPIEWTETKNIKWKVEIPGRGSGSPVVWADRVFILTAVPVGAGGAGGHASLGGSQLVPHKFTVLALDRQTGKVVWERIAKQEAPHEASHPQNGTWASSSAIVDGQHVIAYFESKGIFVYDMNGTLVWEKDLGDKRMRQQFGEGSTPALRGNHLVIVWDHQGQSFIVALDKRTGQELWRQDRAEIDTWATPLIVDVNGRAQVVVPAMRKITSYDLETGRIVWHAPGLTMNPIPSPVAEDGMVYLMSGFQGNNLKAIRLADAKDDLSATTAIAWSQDRDTPYVPSPLLYDGILYFLKSNNGLISAFDAKSGKPHYQLQRLAETPEVFASPVGAAGRVYVTGRDGKTIVMKHGSVYEVLKVNTLDDGFDASPALVDHDLYLRGYRYLYCIAEK